MNYQKHLKTHVPYLPSAIHKMIGGFCGQNENKCAYCKGDLEFYRVGIKSFCEICFEIHVDEYMEQLLIKKFAAK